MSEIAIRTPQDLAAWVRTPERRAELARALPEGVTIDRFERLTTTALLQRPDLLDADQTTLWFALLDAAKRGLAPDGRQGVINVYKTKIKRGGQEVEIKSATFIAMITGVRDELAEYGWALRTMAIFANDTFAYDIAADKVTHQQGPLNDRGEIVGAWAQAIRLRDGFRLSEVLTRAQIEEVRDKARAGNSPLWTQRFRQACEKTAGHRLAKKVPLDQKERERVLAAIASEELEPSAAERLYGPDETSEAPRAASSEPGAGEGTPPETAPSPAPPPDDEPEPSPSVEELREEPAPEPPAIASGEADLQALADEASRYVPPNGKYAVGGQYGPKTLMEIAESGEDGARWLKWALSKRLEPQEYEAAIWSFSRVFAPALYQEALARREAS